MPQQGSPPERIIGLLRQAEVALAQGRRGGEVCRGLGVSDAT
jgi:putative transposase